MKDDDRVLVEGRIQKMLLESSVITDVDGTSDVAAVVLVLEATVDNQIVEDSARKHTAYESREGVGRDTHAVIDGWMGDDR